MHCLMHWLDAMFDPWPPFTFCRPQAIVRTQEFRFQTNLPSPARRGSRSRTASPPTSPPTSPPAPLAIRKAPSASVESIQPRPPRPCEVGRPKGRRRKNRRQSHRFFLAPAAPWRPPREGGHPAGLGAPPSTRQIKGGKVMKTFWLRWMPDVPESAGRPRNAREISWQACCDCVADVRKRVKSTSCRPAFNGDNAPPAHFVHYDSSWRL